MRYLIYGASGFLGGTIYEKLKQLGHTVTGTYATNKTTNNLVHLDVSDTNEALNLYRKVKPDVIIWTILNSDLSEKIAEQTLQPLLEEIQSCRFIFLSTSVAYEQNMDENVAPLIRTEDMYNYRYFNGKIKAESYVKNCSNYVIVRPGSIYGIDAYGNYDVRTKQLLQHIQEKKNYVRANNIVFSIVEVNELADAVIELSQNKYVGIMNISEEQPISHYDFNVALCKRYGWDASFVIGNYEKENIYYFDNTLRKQVLRTEIGELNTKNILLTAFRNSSAELLLKDVKNYKTLLLPNNQVKDSEKLIEIISTEKFDYVISFGQRPNIKNKVHIETTAKDGEYQIVTNFDCESLNLLFTRTGMISKISHNAGTSYCNALYLNVLRYISTNALETKMVFVHIPYENNISDFDSFCKQIFDVIESID